MNRDWSDLEFASAWQLRHVPRWVAVTSIRRQSVAEHEFGVLLIAKYLMGSHPDGDDPTFRLSVYEYLIGHDRDEAITGDLPSPSKPSSDAKTWPQYRILAKCADIMEAMGFVLEEKHMGNYRLFDAVWGYMNEGLEGYMNHLKGHYVPIDILNRIIPVHSFPLMITLENDEIPFD